MKKKSIFRLLILFSLSVILYGCPPDLQLTPEIVTKIYNEGGSNFCYVSVKNTSTTEPCEFALESSTSTQFLQLVSVTPALTNNGILPLQTVVLKYLIKAGAGAACPGGTTPCTFDKIRMRARWDSKEEHDDVPVQWSNPVTQVNCWVTDNGSNDGNYFGLLCNHTLPNNSSGTTPLKFKNVGDVYNPNNFDIDILIDNAPHFQSCIGTFGYGDPRGVWVKIPPGQSYPYGSTIVSKFGGITGACSLANDGSITIHATTTNVTVDASGAKYIPIKYDVQ